MYSTVTFEGNLAADVEVKENKAGGVYVDAVVLVNQSKRSTALIASRPLASARI